MRYLKSNLRLDDLHSPNMCRDLNLVTPDTEFLVDQGVGVAAGGGVSVGVGGIAVGGGVNVGVGGGSVFVGTGVLVGVMGVFVDVLVGAGVSVDVTGVFVDVLVGAGVSVLVTGVFVIEGKACDGVNEGCPGALVVGMGVREGTLAV